MKAHAVLDVILEELKLLRHEGMDSVYMSDESWNYLKDLESRAGITTQSRPSPTRQPAKTEKAKALPSPPVVKLPEGDKSEKWNALRELVLNCKTCLGQVKSGKKVVFGVGNLDAELFFCGEAPGAEEEVRGEPFVGPAGQLLTKIIGAMGLSREQVYIGNIMNWRPDTGNSYGNRPPSNEEMAFCLPYLQAQVSIVRPKVIVALGATAVRGLKELEKNPRMGDLRGKWNDYEGTPLMVTYHPSYLLRNQSIKKKREVWEDMLKVMEKLELPISEKQRGYFLR